MTDAAGEEVWSANYRAWGQAREVISEAARKAGIGNALRFAGQYFDRETGLHYNRHRYYDPNTGRFISKDPIGLLGGLNAYQYVGNNPIRGIDPLGLVDLNLFPSNQAIRGYADSVPGNPDAFQVGAHGNRTLIVDQNGTPVSAQELANMIKSSPNYREGKRVDLLSCNTGRGSNSFAQKLADELGAEVRAPDQYMWYYPSGRTIPMGMNSARQMDHSQPGTMNVFMPNAK